MGAATGEVRWWSKEGSMSPLKVSLHPTRCHVFGHRTHHALPGFGLILAGVALVAHDWADRRRWIADLIAARER